MKHQRPSTIRQVQWDEVREQVRQLDHELFTAIDTISADSHHPFFEVCYPYGEMIMDGTDYFRLPDEKGQLLSITDQRLPRFLREQLGYHSPGAPMGFILDGQIDVYSESQRTHKISHHICCARVFQKGELFALNRVLDYPKVYQISRLWRMVAGTRMPYILSSIANQKKFAKLSHHYDLQQRAPQNMQAHWQFIRDLHNSPNFPTPWYVRILFFGIDWAQEKSSLAKKAFRLVLHERLVEQTAFSRNIFQFDKFNNLGKTLNKFYKKKFDYYIVSMLNFIFEAFYGNAICHQVADARSAGPFDSVATLLVNDYGLEKHAPIILTSTRFRPESAQTRNAYLSLALPTIDLFRERAPNNQGAINDLRELAYIIQSLLHENLLDNVKETTMLNIEQFSCQFFAADADIKANDLQLSSTVFDDDPWVERWRTDNLRETYAYNDFLRACIKFSKNNSK